MRDNDIAEKIYEQATKLERERCWYLVKSMLNEQLSTNLKNPEHVRAYPQWVGRVQALEDVVAKLEKA